MASKPESSKDGAARGRTTNSGKGYYYMGTWGDRKPIHRRHIMPCPESELLRLGNNKAVTAVTAVDYRAPGPAMDGEVCNGSRSGLEEDFLSLTLREEKVKQPKPVGDAMKMVTDTIFIVELFENERRSKTQKLRTRFTFQEDQVQLWVTFFREIAKVEIHQFWSRDETKSDRRDVLWTFTFPTGVDTSGRQAKYFCSKLRYACERMSLTKLAYSNVDRKAILPAAETNFHHTMSRSKTASMLPLIDEGDEHSDDIEQSVPSQSTSTTKKPLRIVLNGPAYKDDDLIFTGAWNDPKMIAMIEKFGIGWDENNEPQPSAIKKKRKSKKKLHEDQEWEKEQRDLHLETKAKTNDGPSRKRSISPGNSRGGEGSRKRATSNSRRG